MREFIEFVAKTLVDHPDRVEVREPEASAVVAGGVDSQASPSEQAAPTRR